MRLRDFPGKDAFVLVFKNEVDDDIGTALGDKFE
jgi:hypothetical protein